MGSFLTRKDSVSALVLGSQATAFRIGEELRTEGYLPVLQDDLLKKGNPILPHIGDPDGLKEMRQLFRDFALFSEGRGIVHPGTTRWAERPELVTLGEETGLTVVCPPSKVLSFFGNKLGFFSEAERLRIPTLVQSFDPMHTVREIEEFVRWKGQGFPFILKSAKGGGNFGLFLVQEPEALKKTLPLWIDQLRRNMGEVILFPEKYLEGARYIVLPFARFQDGRTQLFPAQDASLQSRYRKNIEFCPAMSIDPVIYRQLKKWTLNFIEYCGYVGVGTLEFLVDSSRAFLVEGVPRLNTAFHLWEGVAGTQAVSWQLATLEMRPPNRCPELRAEKDWSSGVALRIYAEDPVFHLPQPGKIFEISEQRKWRTEAFQVELDLALQDKANLSVLDSGLLGLLFLNGRNSKDLISVAKQILNEIWIAGSIQTNERFLFELLEHPWVREGIFHAGFVDEEFLPNLNPPQELLELFPAVCEKLLHSSADQSTGRSHDRATDRSPDSSPDSSPDRAPHREGHVAVQWSVGGNRLKKRVPDDFTSIQWVEGPFFWDFEDKKGVSGQVLMSSGEAQRICAFPVAQNRWQVRLGKWNLPVRRSRRFHLEPKRQLQLSAVVTGRIHAILFRQGAVVPAHETLVIIESFGILVPHSLSYPALIVEWKMRTHDRVYVGETLAHFELLA